MRVQFCRPAVLAVVALALTSISASAATIVWTNAAGGNFSNAANWSPPQVPASSDDAIINLSGTYTVTVDVAAIVHGLYLGGATGTQTLLLNGNNLELSSHSLVDKTGTLQITSGNLNIDSDLTSRGVIQFSGGSISSGNLFNYGSMTIGNNSGKTLDTVTVTNYGTLSWSDTGAMLDIKGVGGSIFNLGTFDITGNSSVISSDSNGTITNLGLMKKSAGSGTTTFSQIAFAITQSSVDGTLEVDSGTMNFDTSTNFLPYNSSTNTLAHGTYLVKSVLMIQNADVRNLVQVNMTLQGSSAAIKQQSGITDVLAGLTTIDSASSLTFKSAGLIISAGATTNNGTLLVDAGSNLQIATYTQASGGATTLRAGSTLKSVGGISIASGGMLDGIGTLDANVTNSGLISVGEAPVNIGTLSITGNLSCSGDVSLKIAGTTPGTYDAIFVNGSPTLSSSSLQLAFVNGFKPPTAAPATLQILTFNGSLTGSFPANPPYSGAACVQALVTAPASFVQLSIKTVATAMWVGASNDWGDMNNWSPPVVPDSSTVNVLIPAAAAIAPVLDTNRQVGDLLIEAQSGTRLDLGAHTLTVNGNLQTSGTITSATGGMLSLDGNVTTFETLAAGGSMPTTIINGFYSAAQASTDVINGNLTLQGSGVLALNSGHVTVNGNYAHTGGSGLLKMQYPSDQLTINGNADFVGEDETGQLTDGLLEIQGTFTTGAATHSFTATPPHVTRFIGASSVSNPATNQGFGNLEIGSAAASANLQFAADIQVAGDVRINQGVATSGAGVTVTLLGNLFDTAGGNWQVSNTQLRSSSPMLPSTLQTHLHFSPANSLGPVVLPAGFTLTGNSDLNVDSGALEIGDKLVVVGHDVLTNSSGFGDLQMTSQFGELSALHDMIFDGQPEDGSLLAGRLRVKHDLHATADEVSKFNASLVHVVTFDGAGAQTVTFDNSSDTFQNVEVNNAAANLSFAQDTLAIGAFTLFNGTVTIPSSTSLTAIQGYIQNAGNTVLAAADSSLVSPSPTGTVAIQGGTLSGIGFVVGNVENSGSVAPGLAGSGNEGELDINGIYTQHPGGALNLRIQSTSIFDSLFIFDGAVDGSLNLSTDGYTGALNDSFDVVNASSAFDGVFATVNGMNISPTLAFTTQYTMSLPRQQTSSTLSLVVLQRPQITNSTLTASGTVGQPFNYTIMTTGSPTIQLSAAPLPDGLTLTGSTISGTPTMAAVGTTQVMLAASSAAGLDTKTLAITIVPVESGPPVVASVTATPNPQRTGVAATFTAVASQPDNFPLTYTWDFQDGSVPVTGNPVQHIFTIENTFNVTVTVSDGISSVQGTVAQQIFAPSSSGTGVVNVTQNDPPAVDPFNGIMLQVASSEGGVLTFAIDINSLLRDDFSVGTDFQSISGRSGTIPGLTVVHKFDDPGVYVATSSATETTTRVLRGKARKTIPISGEETGATPKFTTKPKSATINVSALKGSFIFGRSDTTGSQTLSLSPLAAKTTKPDVVTLSGSIELPEGLDITQPQTFSFGIGNIIDQVTVSAKGKATLPSELGRVKGLTIKYPKLAKGSKLTGAGQVAKFTISISQTGLSAAGFDTEGVTGKLKTGETTKQAVTRSIQVAMSLGGAVWEVQAPVQFKLSTDASSGSISGRSGL